MEKTKTCLKLCDELATKLAAQLSELAEEMPHGPPDADDGHMVFTYILQKLNRSLSGGNLESAKACVQLLHMLLVEESACGIWGES